MEFSQLQFIIIKMNQFINKVVIDYHDYLYRKILKMKKNE